MLESFELLEIGYYCQVIGKYRVYLNLKEIGKILFCENIFYWKIQWNKDKNGLREKD